MMGNDTNTPFLRLALSSILRAVLCLTDRVVSVLWWIFTNEMAGAANTMSSGQPIRTGPIRTGPTHREPIHRKPLHTEC